MHANLVGMYSNFSWYTELFLILLDTSNANYTLRNLLKNIAYVGSWYFKIFHFSSKTIK